VTGFYAAGNVPASACMAPTVWVPTACSMRQFLDAALELPLLSLSRAVRLSRDVRRSCERSRQRIALLMSETPKARTNRGPRLPRELRRTMTNNCGVFPHG